MVDRPNPSPPSRARLGSHLVGLAGALGIAATLLIAGSHAAGAAEETAEVRTMVGEYVWGNGSPQPIEATFTPQAAGRYKVDFRFQFQGRRNHWRGLATGSLDSGRLNGTVREGSRTFRFGGTVVGGVFEGRHAEVYGEEEEDTGTLTLAARK